LLEVTFLGHQGWMVAAGATRILIDPILADFFGALPEAGLRPFPPRRSPPGAWPPIAALFVTSEHEEHFQIASLQRLDRRIPVFLSSRASRAAVAATEALGFEVLPLDGDTHVDLGGLAVRGLAPLLTGAPGDELDVTPVLVRDQQDHEGEDGGTFLCAADRPVYSPQGRLLNRWPAARVVTFASRVVSRHVLTSWQPAPGGSAALVRSLIHFLEQQASQPRPPELVLACGTGWSFDGQLAALNRSFFPGDLHAVVEALNRCGPERRVRLAAPMPGESFLVGRDGVRAGGEPRVAAVAPRSEWPDRSFDPTLPPASRIPALIPGDFSEGDLDRLRACLPLLARGLVGSAPFQALHSLSVQDLGGRARALAIFAQTDPDGDGYLFEYVPNACTFVPARFDVDVYAAGAACWATDLLALLTGQLTVASLTLGHWFEWIGCTTSRPERLSLVEELRRLINPLTMPDAVGALYTRLSRATPPPISIPAGGGPFGCAA
jgi:hypothetical protein